MRSVMLVGKTRCGKTSLGQALAGQALSDKKTQAIEILHAAIDTPGEYLENRRFHRALMVSAVEAGVIVFMQDCTDEDSMFAPGFASMFMGKPVLGVVSKIDKGSPAEQARAAAILREAGAEAVYPVSSLTGEGLDALRSALEE